MSFKDQLRDWLGGWWFDFWHVSPRALLTALGTLLYGIGYLVYRTYTFPSWVNMVGHTFSPLFTLLVFGLFGFNLYRRIRRLFP